MCLSTLRNDCFSFGFEIIARLMIIGVVVAYLIPSAVYAQEGGAAMNPVPEAGLENPVPAADPKTGSETDGPQAYITYKTPYEFYLTAATVALGVLMGGLICILSFRESVNSEILRSFLLVMIIFSALFLIVAGYSEKQTAPVFGLLGTILGYMFGRAVSAESHAQQPVTEPQTEGQPKPKPNP
jgi:hypothetical protein